MVNSVRCESECMQDPTPIRQLIGVGWSSAVQNSDMNGPFKLLQEQEKPYSQN